MHTLKIQRIGNSLGAVLPEEILQRLKVAEGDTLFLIETGDGVQITPHDPNYEAAMQAFEKARQKYHNAFRELAK